MRILEDNWSEHEIRCSHCGKKIGYTVDDISSTHTRGLDITDYGWDDWDCLWHYITCPNCGKKISVNDREDSTLSDYESRYLQEKYDNNW